MKDVKEYLTERRSENEPLSGEWAFMAELYDKRLVKRLVSHEINQGHFIWIIDFEFDCENRRAIDDKCFVTY